MEHSTEASLPRSRGLDRGLSGTRRPTLAVALALTLILVLGLLWASVAAAQSGLRTTLPRVVIRAPDGIGDEPKRPATMRIISRRRGGDRASHRGTDYHGPIGIEHRGFHSLEHPKKSYSFETRTRSGNNRNVSLLGMPKDEDWVLIGNYYDRSLLRNVVAYSAARWLSRYASRTRLVEVIVDGRYDGVYVLSERLKLHERRVAVDDRAISGGYLLEMVDTERIRGQSFFQTPVRDKSVVYADPRREDLSYGRARWISNYIGRFELTLYGPGFTHPRRGFRRYLDIGAAVDYILLDELFKNVATFDDSTYMHKGVGGKLVLGPLWDYNHALGNFVGRDGTDPVFGWQLTDAPWVDRLYADPAFRARVVTRWRRIRRRGLLRHIMRTIDGGAKRLGAAQARNFRRWPIPHSGPVDPRTGSIPQTYGQEIGYLKWWLRSRARWIDSRISMLPR